MSVDPEDEILDDEIELAAAEDYVPEERAKKKAKFKKKASARRLTRAETDGGTVHKGMAKIYRRFTEGGVLTLEEVEDLDPGEREALAIEPRIFEEPPTRVGAWASATVNMGDFNSVKFGAICVVPCYFEEREDAFNCLKEWVTEQVEKEIEEAKGGGSSKPKASSSRTPGRRRR